MTKIDVVSGFLGAGKTTLIKKLLKEALDGSKTVLIENEFGEIGIDGGFLKESGIEIKEMNSGCICCSLVGDFGTSLKEVISTYAPERILIEPSGVGKLSDVLKAVENVAGDLDVEINSAVAVVDASKCKMYMKNFGEFFSNQIEYAGTIILSRTDKVDQAKLNACVEMIREHNDKATIITTPLVQLDGKEVLGTIEGADKLEDMTITMRTNAAATIMTTNIIITTMIMMTMITSAAADIITTMMRTSTNITTIMTMMRTSMSITIITIMTKTMTMSIIMNMTRTAPAVVMTMTTIITIMQTKCSPAGVLRHPTLTAQRTSRRSLPLWTAESTVLSCVLRVWYLLPTEPGYIMIMFPKNMTSEAVSRKSLARSVSSVPNWTRTSLQNCSASKLAGHILYVAVTVG